MSSFYNAGQPAYPTVHTNAHLNGLTKREHFAAMAMQGMLACGASSYRDGTKGFAHSVTVKSIEYADALLKALENDK